MDMTDILDTCSSSTWSSPYLSVIFIRIQRSGRWIWLNHSSKRNWMVLDLTNCRVTTSPPLTTSLWKFCGSCWFNWNRPLFASWCSYLCHWLAYMYSSNHGSNSEFDTKKEKKPGNMARMLLGLNGVQSKHVKRSACEQGTQTSTCSLLLCCFNLPAHIFSTVFCL